MAENANAIVLDEIIDVKPEDITAPKPTKVVVDPIVNQAELITVDAAPKVEYQKLDIEEDVELTNALFSKPTDTLRDSVNTALSDMQKMITGIVNLANSNTAKNTDEFSKKLKEGLDKVNLQIEHIATANAEQSRDAALEINRVKAGAVALINKVSDRTVSNTDRLDAVEKIATGNSEAILKDFQTVKELIESFQISDDGKFLDVLKEMADTADRVNSQLEWHHFQKIAVPVSGIIKVDTRVEGIGEFASASDFLVTANVYGEIGLKVDVINQTKEGFDLYVSTIGKSIKSFPVKNRSVTINVALSHKPFVKLAMDTGFMNEAVVA